MCRTLEQIRRSLRMWLDTKGVLTQAPHRSGATARKPAKRSEVNRPDTQTTAEPRPSEDMRLSAANPGEVPALVALQFQTGKRTGLSVLRRHARPGSTLSTKTEAEALADVWRSADSGRPRSDATARPDPDGPASIPTSSPSRCSAPRTSRGVGEPVSAEHKTCFRQLGAFTGEQWAWFGARR